jgi:hypothetical protein
MASFFSSARRSRGSRVARQMATAAARLRATATSSRPLTSLGVPARAHAIANQKGGVGGDDDCRHRQRMPAEAGERVLLIDPRSSAMPPGFGMRGNGASTHDLLDVCLSTPQPSESRTSTSWRRAILKPAAAGSRRARGERYR